VARFAGDRDRTVALTKRRERKKKNSALTARARERPIARGGFAGGRARGARPRKNGVGRWRRTDQALLGGLPREVADVAAASLGGGGVAERGAVATALGRRGLGRGLVLANGDVAVAEGVA